MAPNEPTSIEVTNITHVAARVQWIVSSIVFSVETYTLMYSTTEDNLNTQMLEPLFSGTDLSQRDKLYYVQLGGLQPGTTYYYQIMIENTIGITLTDVLTFDTRM